MRVYCVQMDVAWEQKRANFLRARGMLRAAGVQPGSLVVFPEMFATGFSMNVERIAEPERGGETERFLSEIAGELRSTVVGGVVHRAPPPEPTKGLNVALACAPAPGGGAVRTVAAYAKMHPFSFGAEAGHYAPGREIGTFPCGPADAEGAGFTCGLSVCYDLRFPELYRRQVREAGATLLVNIANWPVAREGHWLTLLQARAIENQAFVVGCNRVGRDSANTYNGRSMVISPRGEILADGGNWERVVSAEIDAQAVAAWRNEFPALKDAHL